MNNPAFCSIHTQPMSLRTSKTKFEEDGSPKTYYAHSTVDGKLCFGNSVKGQDEGFVEKKYPMEKTKDPEAEGKTRCQIAVAFIGVEGIILDEQKKEIMNDWVTWIMEGK